MLSLYKNPQKESSIIASSYVIYRSNWLEQTQEVRNLLFNVIESFSSSIGVENNEIADETFRVSRISRVELREILAFFHLFIRDLPHPFELTEEQKRLNNPKKPFEYTGDPNWELDESLRQDVQPIEKAVLASLFLDRDEIPIKFRYIHDLMHGTPIERFNRSYTLPDHWEIPLPDHTREVSSLGLEEGTATVEDLRTLRTRSYYHIDKGELMDRVRKTLSKGLFNDTEPRDMDEVRELYDKLLNYKGMTMWEIASSYFPDNEIIYLWNRSMISQFIEKVWHLNPVSERVDNSIPNFKVTHHRMVRDEDRLIPTIDTEVWTNDQLRDALGYDWMYDQNLTLEDNWMDTGRDIDYHMIDRIAAFADQVAAILPFGDDYQGGFLIRTDSDHVFLEPRKNLLERMGNPNHVDVPLREDSDSQPVNPSVERCLYNGSTLRDFSLVRDNLLRSLDMREFSDWEYKPRENSSLFHNTSGLQGAYMLNLFFHQNRLDGLYSWYQDIYLSNVRYLREYLRSVNLNSDYQVNDDGLTLSDEWQLYLRNSNIFVDAYVRNFGRLSYPFVELNDPNATSNDLNNLKLLRLSLMSDMDYLCFLTQSHFLRSLVDKDYLIDYSSFTKNLSYRLNLLTCLSEKSMLLDDSSLIMARVQVNNVTFDEPNLLDLSPRLLETIQEHDLYDLSSVQPGDRRELCQSILELERKFRISKVHSEIFSLFKNKYAWLDYLTLTRFLQDDPFYQDQLDWTCWIDSHFDEHIISPQEQLDRLMFQDVNCQIYNQVEHDRIPESDRQNLLDQWYLSSENRKVSPNLHNRELRSLLPVFLMSQVLGGDELNMDFLPTNEQLNDPVRFVSSLELANSFFDDYNSRKTWSDEDIDMLERVLTEYDQLNSLSEELSEEFFHYVRQGNCDGITDLLLLLDVTQKDKYKDRNKDNIYLKLNNHSVSILNLRRKIRDSLLNINVYDWSEFTTNENFKILRNLRMIESFYKFKLSSVKKFMASKAPFLRQLEHRKVSNVIDLKLLYLDDSVIRNIFVRNNTFNKLVRTEARNDEPSLVLPSLNFTKNRQVIDQVIRSYIINLDTTDLVEELVRDRAWVSQGLYLESDYLGWLLKDRVNSEMIESPHDFLRQVREVNQRLSTRRSNRLTDTIQQLYTDLIGSDDTSITWENPEVNLDRIGGALMSKDRHLRLLLGFRFVMDKKREEPYSLFGVRLPIEMLKLSFLEDNYNQLDDILSDDEVLLDQDRDVVERQGWRSILGNSSSNNLWEDDTSSHVCNYL